MFQIQEGGGGAYFGTDLEWLAHKIWGLLGWSAKNLLGVLLLFKISRNLVESNPFKTSCNFPKKSSNFLKVQIF